MLAIGLELGTQTPDGIMDSSSYTCFHDFVDVKGLCNQSA